MMDSSARAVIARNDTDKPVQIPRNYRLGHVIEMDYPNAFLISADEDVRNLAVREPKATHQDGWFKKLVSACATAYVAASAIPSASVHEDPLGGLRRSSVTAHPSLPQLPLEKPSANETVLPNGITICNSSLRNVDTFSQIVKDYPTLWQDTGFANLPEENWMRIPLKSDWEARVSGKAKVYPLGNKDKELVDKTFDELHASGRMSWTNESTSFSYPVFCVWRNQDGERKGRVVVDIRGLNALTQPDAYPLPLQADIIALLRDCPFITVIDCSAFFYQWRVHPLDRHKLTVVSHRGQESFNVAVMGYKNSPAYVQRQIDRLLRAFRQFARAYVDDIVIFSRTADAPRRNTPFTYATSSAYLTQTMYQSSLPKLSSNIPRFPYLVRRSTHWDWLPPRKNFAQFPCYGSPELCGNWKLS